MRFRNAIFTITAIAGISLGVAAAGPTRAAPMTAPGVPHITAPAFDSSVTLPVTLSWRNPTDTIAGTTVFRIHFQDTADVAHPIDFMAPADPTPGAEITSTRRGTGDGLQPGHVYYWWVTGCNPDGCGTQSTSSPVTFTINTEEAAPATGTTGDSATLHGTYEFDLEGGHELPVGDIWWEQIDPTSRRMVPVNGAAIRYLGMVNFDGISGADLQAADAGYTSQPLVDNPAAGNQLAAGAVFAVRTRGGSYAKVQVLRSGYDLLIQWVTYAAE